MAVATPVTSFECPGCGEELAGEQGGRSRCPLCGWQGEAYLFRPLAVKVERAKEALPEDAVCAHHPTKQAVEVCAGTGDYICSLCAVKLEGKQDGHGLVCRIHRLSGSTASAMRVLQILFPASNSNGVRPRIIKTDAALLPPSPPALASKRKLRHDK